MASEGAAFLPMERALFHFDKVGNKKKSLTRLANNFFYKVANEKDLLQGWPINFFLTRLANKKTSQEL